MAQPELGEPGRPVPAAPRRGRVPEASRAVRTKVLRAPEPATVLSQVFLGSKAHGEHTITFGKFFA